MKSYKVWQEGWFSKKEPEDKDEKELMGLYKNLGKIIL